MIIKTMDMIIDTNTYDSFAIQFDNRTCMYQLVAINKNDCSSIVMAIKVDRTLLMSILDNIYDAILQGKRWLNLLAVYTGDDEVKNDEQ